MNQVRTSAGLLMYRLRDDQLQVFLAHPGGPFFQYKDNGHWTIPKGELAPGEDLLMAAVREFKEETCIEASGNNFIPLGSIRQRGGKIVHGWAFEGDCPQGTCTNATFSKWNGLRGLGAGEVIRKWIVLAFSRFPKRGEK